MRRLPLRRLVAGGAVEPERIFHHNLWYRGHTNRRYEELLPRLERVDAYLLFVPEWRPARGIVYRLLGRSPDARAAIVRAGSRRYRSMFATELEQVAHFDGPVVADLDDPQFSAREAELLQRPNVAAYVVTAERAARRFAELGVEKPVHVIPQGVAEIDPAATAEVRRTRRRGEIVVGHIAPWLLLGGDRGGSNALYNVEHLLELWQEIRARVPAARLWLVGEPSSRLRERVGRRDDVVLIGRLPPAQALAHVANFDIALYARAEEIEGVRRVKIAEYLGAGIPTVSYDFESVADLRESGAGVLVSSSREFVTAVERLARDDVERGRLATAAREAGKARHWDLLAGEMESVLDRYLPPGTLVR
jgi:glycosyltransferase involved in cell wall biosynthesis